MPLRIQKAVLAQFLLTASERRSRFLENTLIVNREIVLLKYGNNREVFRNVSTVHLDSQSVAALSRECLELMIQYAIVLSLQLVRPVAPSLRIGKKHSRAQFVLVFCIALGTKPGWRRLRRRIVHAR
jgi:hypothetical protein